MDPIELTISDGEETYVIGGDCFDDGTWAPTLLDQTSGQRVPVWNPTVQIVAAAGPYPTPYACLEAMFRAVVTELFGVKA